MATNLRNLSLEELKAKKKQLQTRISMAVVGTIVYAAFIFYLMYTSTDAAASFGKYLIIVPIILFLLATFINPAQQQINREITRRMNEK